VKPATDDVIPGARRLMAFAAEQIEAAKATLREANRLLRSHPDYKATETAEKRAKGRGLVGAARALDAMTMTRWLGHCVDSILEDASIANGARLLRSDLKGDGDLADFIAEERRCLDHQAKTRGVLRKAA